MVPAAISKTGFVEFETNRYSVPSNDSERPCEILAYPDHLEVRIKGNRIAIISKRTEVATTIATT